MLPGGSRPPQPTGVQEGSGDERRDELGGPEPLALCSVKPWNSKRAHGCGGAYLGTQWPTETGWLESQGTKSSITSAHRVHKGE